MKEIRTCESAALNTGTTKCPIDFGKMKGAIIVHEGNKLPSDLTLEELEKLCHADRPERVYGIKTFCEYAPNGGEVQTAANGYGGLGVTGVSDRTDAFTLDRHYPELHASLLRASSQKWGAYFFDGKGYLYGIDDGTEVLAPFNMAAVFSDATPYPTSSAKETMSVKFCHADSYESIEKADFIKIKFNPLRAVLGLELVELVKAKDAENEYKLIEKVGRYDLTPLYGAIIAEKATLIKGSTAVTFNEEKGTLTVTATAGATLRLAAPSELYEAGIKGIEQA